MKSLFKKKIVPICIGLSFLTIALGLQTSQWNHSGLIKKFDRMLYDTQIKMSFSKKVDTGPIVIVDIDEKSLKEEGQWPWPRDKIATLINNMRKAGAAIMAFDMVFSEPEENPAKVIIGKIFYKKNVDKKLITYLENITNEVDNDLIFSKSLAYHDVILGFLLHHHSQSTHGILPKPLMTLNKHDSQYLTITKMEGYSGNISILQESGVPSGFITTIRDEDGVMRRSPLVLRYGNAIYPSLALEAVKQYWLIEKQSLDLHKLNGMNVLEHVLLGSTKIPTDAIGQVAIPFKGPAKTFPYISATDVLNEHFSKEALDNKLVFIGTSALGLSDLVSTPMHRAYPGIEVHANIAAGILENNIAYQPYWGKGLEFMLTGLIGLIFAFTLPYLGAISLAIIPTLAFIGLIFANFILWSTAGLIIHIIIPLLLIISLTIFNLIYGFFFEHLAKERTKKIFGRYVPPEHVNILSENPNLSTLQGDNREMTILFADIRNFTQISESMDAMRLKKILNSFFTPMTKIIFQHDGTIDKYVGDMIMAFWGAPIKNPEHARDAIESGLHMLKKVDDLRNAFLLKGLPEFNIGIGINTGMMNVGDMGSKYRQSYTVIGDAVNLGSRLESLTKYYGIPIIVSESSRNNLDHIVFRHIDKIKVKGKMQSVNIYQPLGFQDEISQEMLDEIKQHEEALLLYFQCQWKQAKSAFYTLHQQYPERRLYMLFIEHIDELQNHINPKTWDGAYVQSEK